MPAGTDIQFRLHYTANGKDVIDRPRLGFTVVKEPPKRQYVNFVINSAQEPAVFAISPNNPNWQARMQRVPALEGRDIVPIP